MFNDGNHREKHVGLTQEQLNRNIRIFQITGIDVTVLLVPVLALVWIRAGLTFSEMLVLQGIFMIPILLLEVPSGSFADYWSRKGCTALFHVLFGAGIFFYAIGDTFLMFAIGEFLAGIGITFKTGSDTALVYDSLLTRDSNPNGYFGKLVSNRMSIMFGASAIGAILGGIIATVTLLKLPIFLTVLGHIGFALLVTLGYTEPPRIQAKSPRAAIITAAKSLSTKKELQLVLIVMIAGTVFSSIGFWASQHAFINDYTVDALGMGLIIALFNLTAGLSSLAIRSKVSRLANSQMLFLLILIDGIYLLGLMAGSSLLGVIVLSLFGQLTRGSRTPLTQAIVQDQISSMERATFSSLISLVGSSLYFAFSTTINIFELSRQSALVFGFIGIIICTIGFLALNFREFHLNKVYTSVFR
ncbi:MAG: MFS transporter [Candidatus Hodarchaeales archaeon]|jgi:MFS family permease